MYAAHNAGGDILSKRFLQKYLYYAKHRPWQPVLTSTAEGYIAEQYSQWRVDKVRMLCFLKPTSKFTRVYTDTRLETLALGEHCPSRQGHLRR